MNRPRPTRKLTLGSLELLDDRIVPSGVDINALPVATQEAFVTERAGTTLGSVFTQYENYEAAGAAGTFTPTQAGQLFIKGTTVDVNLTFVQSQFNMSIEQLKGIGMQVTAISNAYSTVEGFLPINELPEVASDGYATTIAPVYRPVLYGPSPTPSPAFSVYSLPTSTQEAFVTERAGTTLGSIFTQYINDGSTTTFTPTQANQVFLSGTSVEVDITFVPGQFSMSVEQMKGIGMQVTAISTTTSTVEGYFPIAELPELASDGYATTIAPVFRPTLF